MTKAEKLIQIDKYLKAYDVHKNNEVFMSAVAFLINDTELLTVHTLKKVSIFKMTEEQHEFIIKQINKTLPNQSFSRKHLVETLMTFYGIGRSNVVKSGGLIHILKNFGLLESKPALGFYFVDKQPVA